jgi:hypothetical protein
MTGPFTTDLNKPDGRESRTAFSLKEIKENPAWFFVDSHTNLFSLGAVRGHLA